jgi:hypothetical protein
MSITLKEPLKELGVVVWCRPDFIQYRDKWQALVKMVINIWVPQIAWNFLTSRGNIKLSRNRYSAPCS